MARISYICAKCAKELKASWPEGHLATFHNSKCHWCSKEAGVCHVSDYNWPDSSMFKSQEKSREI